MNIDRLKQQCDGPDGMMLTSWNYGVHHFEIECFPDGRQEYFYMNRQTGAYWDYEDTILSTEFPLELTYYFLKANPPNPILDALWRLAHL